jgi:peptidoglycan/LPS O-acetylase OafA/YrhL
MFPERVRGEKIFCRFIYTHTKDHQRLKQGIQPMNRILNSLQRITSSTKFIPEIDGLRFVAIMSVILYHVNVFITGKNLNTYFYSDSRTTISDILSRGHLGVELFFVISGFILSYPFASHYLAKTGKPVLKQYFIRRITRLEPPYIVSMLIFFVALIITAKYSFSELLPHLFASLTYTHNIFYPGSQPLINAVAWSLEIEIQFYIIAPVLAKVFLYPARERRLIIILFVFMFAIIQNYIKSPILSIINYVQYFGIGFLLADLKITNTRLKFSFNNSISILTGIASFVLIWYSDTHGRYYSTFVKNICNISLVVSIFIFYYLVLFNDIWKRIFSIQIITVIGGMCYSIYLLHYQLISLLGNKLVNTVSVSNYYAIDFIIYSIILILVSIAGSAIYFKLIEQPCMKKDWHIQLMQNIKSRLHFN